MGDQPNSDGRKDNEAEALGDFTALGDAKAVEKTGGKSREKAGPDGPSAAEVGDTFKRKP
ncbi:hypothetical protein [Caulobacter hibisci]|uniref:Uncharacterized protein n=1 Tax=Caulobacter hibisci TaxID=2035993 RepID=A0ABS0T4Q7_9CAUL|nr:hypothetical protein [Caulobacter hibisci]MBI1686875.1 hypothetical protein [Caulobacter hibisci]